MNSNLQAMIDAGVLTPAFIGNQINPALPQLVQDAMKQSIDKQVDAIAKDIDLAVLQAVAQLM